MKKFDIYESNRASENYMEKITELKLDLLDRGLHVQWTDENGNNRSRLLFAEEIYKLIMLYDDVLNSDDRCIYRLDEFAKKCLKDTGADDCTEVYSFDF